MSKVDKKKAAEAKDKGNKFFLAKQYSQAVEWYTKAVQADPTDSAFYSNRAAAYMGMNKFEEALADSEQCIKLMPNWVKGYYRKGAALVSLGRHEEAVRAFRKGLECDPSNDDLKQRLADAEREAKFTVKRFDEEGRPLSAAQIAKEEGNVLFRENQNTRVQLPNTPGLSSLPPPKKKNQFIIPIVLPATLNCRITNRWWRIVPRPSTSNLPSRP